MVFIVGRVRRPILTAQERLPYHRSQVQSFLRTYRYWATGVNPVMLPTGMDPRVVKVHAGFNIWFDPSQGFYWVDGFKPAFGTRGEAEGVGSVLPYALILGAAKLLF